MGLSLARRRRNECKPRGGVYFAKLTRKRGGKSYLEKIVISETAGGGGGHAVDSEVAGKS